MPIGWGVLVSELAKAGNKILDHTLKPAVEKMKDIRFVNVKRWIKWKKKSDQEQKEREKSAQERDRKAKELKL